MKKSKLKKLASELTKLSHDHVRRRDSINDIEIGGRCFDCGYPAFGQQFQCGHWIPDAAGGVTLRYHPQNMHGQSGGCNMKYRQEDVKINYTFAMIEKYGNKRVEALRRLRQKTRQADEQFFTTMIELYKQGNEKKIIKFLEQ